MFFRSLTVLLVALFLVLLTRAQVPDGHTPDQPMPMAPATPEVLSMEERAAVINDWLDARLDTVVAQATRAEDVDLWIVSGREYNEDPVLATMLPATWQSARRRTMLVFHDRGPEAGIERLAIARYDVGELFETAWDKEEQPDQWARLAEVVRERDPERIAVNRSETFALADGMTDTEFSQLRAALPARYRDRLVSGEGLAVRWLETRIEAERTVYPQVVRLARSIIATGLSEQVIQPGVTTTADVAWWYRTRIRDLNLTAWFHPSVSLQRPNTTQEGDFSSKQEARVIRPGDLLHVTLGISYLRPRHAAARLRTAAERDRRPGWTSPRAARDQPAAGPAHPRVCGRTHGRRGAPGDPRPTQRTSTPRSTRPPLGSTARGGHAHRPLGPAGRRARQGRGPPPPTPPTPSNSTRRSTCRNGTGRRCSSGWRRRPSSRATPCATSTGGRRNSI